MTPVQRRWLALILIVAGLLRLPALLADPVVSVDESRYLRLAAAAPAHPEVLVLHNYHPAYPAALVPVVALAPDAPERPARLLSLLLGLVAVVCCFGLARERFGVGAALFAAALCALSPGPVEGAGHVLSEAVYFPALLGACWALVRLLRHGGWGAAACFGGLTGLAYLTRPEGLAPAVVGLGWLAVGGAAGGVEAPVSVKRRLGLLGVSVLALLLVAGPYMAAIGGLTRKKATGLSALDAKMDQHSASAALERISATWIGTSDVPSSEHSPVQEFLHEWFSSPTPVFWLIALAGAVWLLQRRVRPGRLDAALGGTIAVFVAAHLLLLTKAGYLSSRHVWPVAALALPWLGAGLHRVRDWAPVARPWAGRALAAAAIAGLAGFGVAAAAWPWQAQREYIRTAGRQLRPLAGPSVGIMATDARIAYYARAKPLVIGRVGWTELLRQGRERGARYIACDVADLQERVEGYRRSDPPGVREVARIEIPPRRGRPASVLLVYEIPENQ